MKILILTQYYPPETGAPQNRLHSLAHHLSDFGAEVTVLTAMPHYPKMTLMPEYRGKWFCRERDGGIRVFRSWIYVTRRKSIWARLLNYFSFVITSAFVAISKIEKHDIVICESPPLFLGMSALVIKYFKGSKLIFNVSDLWPETAEKLNIIRNKAFLGLAYRLEAAIYKRSELITGQTQGIVKNISERFPFARVHWLPNGIDLKRYATETSPGQFRGMHSLSGEEFVVMYAGILGYAQGLEVILDCAKRFDQNRDIRFLIIGDGPTKEALISKAAELGIRNVQFVPNIPYTQMPSAVAACDVFVVPLKKNDLFLGAIPSKLFEPLAMGKPILLGVDGEARNLFIEQGNAGLFFEPENSCDLYQKLNEMLNDRQRLAEMGSNGKSYVSKNFNRHDIALSFLNVLQTI
jgi:glycosyltransferase involved in cell wall biosynthesis